MAKSDRSVPKWLSCSEITFLSQAMSCRMGELPADKDESRPVPLEGFLLSLKKGSGRMKQGRGEGEGGGRKERKMMEKKSVAHNNKDDGNTEHDSKETTSKVKNIYI